MHTLTGSCQSSFIRGHLASDNIQVVQEAVHTLSRWKGKKAGMILKVDFEKAYDRVDWQFLRHILNISGFWCILISLIMDIITSTSLRVCWNEEALAAFSPSRGLRQGHSLSLYLFILSTEVLHHSISRTVASGVWKLLQASPGGPSLSHQLDYSWKGH